MKAPKASAKRRKLNGLGGSPSAALTSAESKELTRATDLEILLTEVEYEAADYPKVRIQSTSYPSENTE